MKKVRNKKIYKIGGVLPGGEEVKTVSSGTAYTTNSQGTGSTGTVLQDPYAFAKSMGVTTLTPEQWKKLDAGQQQVIWRQGFEKAGFSQIGTNSFSTNGQPNKFDLGGSIGSALGGAMQFIPGVGPILSQVATPLLSAAGSAIDKTDQVNKIPIAPEVARTVNPYGNYKQGGSLPQYGDGGSPSGDGYVQPKEVYDYLISKGVSKQHALGMLANIQYESSFRPHAIGDGGKSGGFFQHHATRFEAMKKYAGDDWKTDWKGQIDYALSEQDTKNYLSQQFKTPEEASTWFTTKWERPADATAKAQERLAALKDFTFANSETFIDGAAGRIVAAGEKQQATNSAPDPMLLKYREKINQLSFSVKKYGGQIAKNVVATSGGKFEDLGSNILLATGKLHSEGGIKVDTKSVNGFDGIADVEVEDGEPIITDAGDTGYVINRDIAKPYIKLLKQLSERHDKVSETGRDLMKQEMIKKNEVMKASKASADSGTPKFVDGGLFSNLGAAVREYNGAPVASSFYNPFGGSYSAGATFGDVDPQPTTPMSLTMGTNSNSVTPLKTSSSTFSVDNTNEALKTPTGDIMQMAGLAIPTLYNLGRGLFDKAETVSPEYNPYEGAALSTLKSRSYNPQAIQNQLDRTFSAGSQQINDMTSSAGTRLGNIQNLYSNLGQQRAAVDLQGQQMNNQYKADYAGALDNFGRQRMSADAAALEYNWSNQVAKDQFISEGVSNLGQTLTSFGQQKNTAAMNAIGLKTLNEAFPNYYFDAGTINQLISGVKPSWMKDSEFEQAKMLLYRSGLKK